MLKFISFLTISFFLLLGGFLIRDNFGEKISGAPPFGAPKSETESLDPYSVIRNWTRPAGPAKVGIQVGHWKNDEVPEELKNLRNNTGASGGGKAEWEVNYEIANLIAENLNAAGVTAEILPTTVPQNYWADVFIAIHADGSEDPRTTGYKFAGPWRDFTGKSDQLVDLLSQNYEDSTGLVYDPNISRNMRGYYAFSWWRYDHAIHPMTTAVIAETGFLTNANDRKIIVDNPEISADPISESIIEFLRKEELL